MTLPVLARLPKTTSTTPFEWAALVTAVWHSPHAVPAESAPATRWRWWAPTPRALVAVLPLVSAGGAAGSEGLRAVATRAASPWQEVHERVRSRTPFTWVAGSKKTFAPPAWQAPQGEPGATVGWGAGGGAPWQLPQEISAAPPVQTGWACEPPPRVAPWQ